MNKTISIPYQINEKLKLERNASALISSLLAKYYNEKENKNLSIEEIDKLIKIEETKLEYENKLKEIK